jgi:hypothetical protein
VVFSDGCAGLDAETVNLVRVGIRVMTSATP